MSCMHVYGGYRCSDTDDYTGECGDTGVHMGKGIETCKVSAQLDRWFPQKGSVTKQLELLQVNWIDCIVYRW